MHGAIHGGNDDAHDAHMFAHLAAADIGRADATRPRGQPAPLTNNPKPKQTNPLLCCLAFEKLADRVCCQLARAPSESSEQPSLEIK